MRRPLRVFHLIKGLGRGGAERLLVDAQRLRDPARLEFGYGYFLPWKDALVPDLLALGADVRCFGATGPARMAAALPSVALHLRRWRADVVHCHLPLSGVIGRLAGALTRRPIVYTEHNLQERYHPLTRWANLRTWGLQAGVIAVSDEVARSADRHAGGRVPVRVIRNGIALDRVRPDPALGLATRRALGLGASSPIVGTVAVFRAQKRLDLWLEAADLVRRRVPDARFLLVGDGPERPRLEALARERSLTDAVVFAGLKEDVRPYLAALDVFLMSSQFEGLPLALLEAMAMERGVVATAVGGVPEALASGGEGLLVPPGSAEALAGAVVDLLDDAPRRAALGAAARGRVAREFSMLRMLEELEAAYTHALRGAAA